MSVLAWACLLLASSQDLPGKIDGALQRLADDALDVREAAASELGELGPDAVPLLRERLDALDAERKGRVQESIRRIEERQRLARVLPPLRRATLEAAEKPLRDVLEEISKQTGIPIDLSGGTFDGPLTISLKDALPLQAFDEACAKAGGFSYRVRRAGEEMGFNPGAAPDPSGSALFFQPTAGPAGPAAYAKSYRLRLNQITLTRTNDFRRERSSATLQMEILWPPPAAPHSVSEFRIVDAVDDRGRSLLPAADPNNAARFQAGFNRNRFRNHWTGGSYHALEIAYPAADAAKIASLKCALSVVYPGDERALVFEKPADARGESRELHGLKVMLKDCKSDGQDHTIQLEISGRFAPPGGGTAEGELPFTHDEVVVVSRSGARLRANGMSGSSDGKSHQWELRVRGNLAEPVQEIRIPVILAYHTDSAAFELKDIPLPR
jgi:hypothetical protein